MLPRKAEEGVPTPLKVPQSLENTTKELFGELLHPLKKFSKIFHSSRKTTPAVAGTALSGLLHPRYGKNHGEAFHFFGGKQNAV